MEIHFFIKKMESFQKNINKIDINLSNSLIDILHNIQSFIDNSEIIQTTNTSFTLNDNECIQIQRNYYCLACNVSTYHCCNHFVYKFCFTHNFVDEHRC